MCALVSRYLNGVISAFAHLPRGSQDRTLAAALVAVGFHRGAPPFSGHFSGRFLAGSSWDRCEDVLLTARIGEGCL